MDSPYATIIVPIIDRAETLPVAVTAGLEQSRRDIEILIACSGATPQVLAVAHDFARRDSRVRVLDLPPSAVTTSNARAAALRQARSDRIFILQDDDLWFPRHVELVGALLDDADLASTVSMAATLSGRVMAWPCTFHHSGYRQAYAKGTSKLLYEAHYAFRRSSYDRLDVGWDRQTVYDLPRNLLSTHVANADRVRFASAAVPTALSLNSPPRHGMTTPQRAEEMIRWRRRFAAGETPRSLLDRATYAPMFDRLLRTEPPGVDVSLPQYLSRYGLRLDADRSDDGPQSGGLDMTVTDRQREHLEVVFSLSQGTKVAASRVVPIVADMLEPFANRAPDTRILGVLWRLYGPAAALNIFTEAAANESDSQRGALIAVALASLSVRNKDVPAAVRNWQAAEALSPRTTASCVGIAASVAAADGRTAFAVDLLERAIQDGGSARLHVQLIRLELAGGRIEAARERLREGLAKFPASAALLQLARKQGAAIATTAPTE